MICLWASRILSLEEEGLMPGGRGWEGDKMTLLDLIQVSSRPSSLISGVQTSWDR